MIEIDKNAIESDFRVLTPADGVQVNRVVSRCPFCGQFMPELYGTTIDAKSINERYHTRSETKVILKAQVKCMRCGASGSLIEQDKNRISFESRSNNAMVDLAVSAWNSRRI